MKNYSFFKQIGKNTPFLFGITIILLSIYVATMSTLPATYTRFLLGLLSISTILSVIGSIAYLSIPEDELGMTPIYIRK